jgi:hypothetical protein
MSIQLIKKFIADLETKKGNWTYDDFIFHKSLIAELKMRTREEKAA